MWIITNTVLTLVVLLEIVPRSVFKRDPFQISVVPLVSSSTLPPIHTLLQYKRNSQLSQAWSLGARQIISLPFSHLRQQIVTSTLWLITPFRMVAETSRCLCQAMLGTRPLLSMCTAKVWVALLVLICARVPLLPLTPQRLLRRQMLVCVQDLVAVVVTSTTPQLES